MHATSDSLTPQVITETTPHFLTEHKMRLRYCAQPNETCPSIPDNQLKRETLRTIGLDLLPVGPPYDGSVETDRP